MCFAPTSRSDRKRECSDRFERKRPSLGLRSTGAAPMPRVIARPPPDRPAPSRYPAISMNRKSSGSAVVISAARDEPSPSQMPSTYGSIGRSAAGSARAPASGIEWFRSPRFPCRNVVRIWSVVRISGQTALARIVGDRSMNRPAVRCRASAPRLTPISRSIARIDRPLRCSSRACSTTLRFSQMVGRRRVRQFGQSRGTFRTFSSCTDRK